MLTAGVHYVALDEPKEVFLNETLPRIKIALGTLKGQARTSPDIAIRGQVGVTSACAMHHVCW